MNPHSPREINGQQELSAVMVGSQESYAGQVMRDTVEDFRWEPIIYFYCLYIGIIWIGDVLGFPWVSSLGAALFLVCLYAKYWRCLFAQKLNMVLFCIILSAILPLIPIVSLDENVLSRASQELIKYYALNFVILIGMGLPLTPLTRARRAWLLYVLILAFLLSGWMWAPVQASAPDPYTATTRVKGFLVNGNVFALTAMILLMLVDEDRSGKLIKSVTLVVVLFLIYISHTSGAMMAFLVGMLYRFIHSNSKSPVVVRWIVVATGLIAAVAIFISIPPNTFKAVDATTEKFKIAWENIEPALSHKRVDYYAIIERRGQDVTSGAWRLYHWSHVMNTFWDADLDKILFGHGIGTMGSSFGIIAHNDYLRFLFQTGVIGFFLNMVIWATLYRRMEVRYRWVVVMIAFFCISENNYDHFPTMSLLALYMIGAKRMDLNRPQSVSLPAGEKHPVTLKILEQEK